MTVKYVTLAGGLDLEAPPLEARPGTLLEGLNFYESVKGGYTTVKGYERFDGQPSPTAATYHYILIDDYDLVAGAVNTAVGDTVVIGTITFDVAYREVSTDGTQLIMIGHNIVGEESYPLPAFDTNGIVTEITYKGGDEARVDEFFDVVRETRRAVIIEVPGADGIRGVAQINDLDIAWRDTGADLKAYRSTAASWVEIPHAAVYEVDVSAATAATVGDLCNSGADKILGVYDYLTAGAPDSDKRVYVVKSTGSVPTGFTNDVGAVNHGSVLGTVAWTPAAGGSIRYINHNFFGGLDTYNMYFADGVNVAMLYNVADDIVQPISADYRTLSEVIGHVVAHNSRLFMSTSGGTFLTSTAGLPDVVDGFLGSEETGVGDVITGFAKTGSEFLAIFTDSATHGRKGTSASNWVQQVMSAKSGAKDSCIAQIDDVFSADERGISKLERAEKLGGFDAGTVTDKVQTLYSSVVGDASCATTLRKLNQMRFYFGNRFLMLSRVPYNANGNEGIRYGISEGEYLTPVNHVSTESKSDGTECTLFGSTTGYVYKADTGTSFDGEEIECIMSSQFNHFGTPNDKKRFTGLSVEGKSAGYAEFQMYYYMNDGQKSFNPKTAYFPGNNARYDEGEWDDAQFDAAPLTRPKLTLRGTGYNIQLSFYRISKYQPQATLTGYVMRYKTRGLTTI